MYRKLMRWTLLILIILAALYTVWPSVAGALDISISGDVTENRSVTASDGSCRTNGVTLVVDYGADSGKTAEVVCVTGFGNSASDSGWNLFAAANQTVAGTVDYPTGFVCRINGYPSSKEATCASTSNLGPGRWVYFKAVDSHGWAYSHIGAALDKPACGNWEGWRYVEAGNPATSVPGINPKPFKCSN